MLGIRAVNLSCELNVNWRGGGGVSLAERMNIKCAVGHGTTSNLWHVLWEWFEG